MNSRIAAGAPRRRFADRRAAALVLTALGVIAGGYALQRAGSPPADRAPAAATAASAPHAGEVQRLFSAAVVMLHAKRYDDAVTALHRVLVYAPDMPEAHVNMGYALLGLQRLNGAGDFFSSAIELRPDQANAYYGLALAHEARGDKAAALGAMRSYLHLARDERPEHLRRARAALWEWEQQAPAAGGR
jgi:tetratricopeptide (TPR) repeat protein